jgi:signal peptidase I
MGDHRSTSADSRSVIIGPVSEEQLIGKVFLRIWPPNKIGLLN